MNYKNVHSIIKRLEKLQLVKTENFGQSRRVKLNNITHPLIFEAEYERAKEISKNKDIEVMLNNFKRALNSKLYILLLFGSHANKTHTKNSDIHLMFICPNGFEEIFEKNVKKVTESTPLPLHTFVFSENQFIEMINTKEPNVGHEALKNNVILYGIEQYYELI